jgi:hypothetical protein
MPPAAKVSREPPSPAPAKLSLPHPCGENEFPAHVESRQYSGLYDQGFERSAFTFENSSCTVWLTGNLQEACRLAEGCQEGSEFMMLRLTVDGELSPSGSYGHLGMYERELRVGRVLASTVVSR